MSERETYFCDHCIKKVEFSNRPIQCDTCFYWFHGTYEKNR